MNEYEMTKEDFENYKLGWRDGMTNALELVELWVVQNLSIEDKADIPNIFGNDEWQEEFSKEVWLMIEH